MILRISYENGLYFISQTHKYETLPELVQHHHDSADGLVATLKFPIPNRKNRMQHHNFDYDRWEINRDEIRMGKMVGSGQYGDVYKAYVTSLGLHVAVKTLREDNQGKLKF